MGGKAGRLFGRFAFPVHSGGRCCKAIIAKVSCTPPHWTFILLVLVPLNLFFRFNVLERFKFNSCSEKLS